MEFYFINGVFICFLVFICFAAYSKFKHERKEKERFMEMASLRDRELSSVSHNFGVFSDEISALKSELEKIKKNPSYDCQLLLSELFSGQALIKIEPIDKNDLFIWRNK